ncbi:MAG: ATP-binding protein [Endomicrobiales bacterium]
MSTTKIATKFLVSVSLLVVFTAMILSFLFTHHELIILKDAQQDYADSLAHALAYNAEYGVLTKNLHVLQTLIKGIVNDPRINRVEIVDSNGNSVYAYGTAMGHEYTSRAEITSENSEQEVRPTKKTNESILFAPNEESGRRNSIGEVRLSLSLNDMYAKLAQIHTRVIMITFLVALAGIIITIVLVKKITAPLEDLVTATATIADGNLEHHVSVTTDDEIGQLGAAFNRMTAELSQTLVSKTYVNNIIQSMMGLLVVVNVDNTIHLSNQATQDVLGYREEELVGKPILTLFADKSDSMFDNISSRLNNFSHRGMMRNIEKTFITKAGAHIPVLLTASPMMADNGSPLGIVVAALDISERVKAENEKNIMKERMMQMEKMSAMGQLASGITHEINNPLGVILGFAQSALKTMPTQDPLYSSLSTIEREASRCRDIVTEMLAFSRSTKINLQPEDINKVISSALVLIEARTKNTSLILNRDFDPHLPPIMINANQVQQIVINLCNNAIDAMNDKGRLTIRTLLTMRKEKKFIEVQFRDTGPGIPKDFQRKIFEPFFTTKEDSKGTGLGLSLVYEIVQRHCGSIELESEVGKGALFKILLPLEQAH